MRYCSIFHGPVDEQIILLRCIISCVPGSVGHGAIVINVSQNEIFVLL
jgi:hypothetical protein